MTCTFHYLNPCHKCRGALPSSSHPVHQQHHLCNASHTQNTPSSSTSDAAGSEPPTRAPPAARAAFHAANTLMTCVGLSYAKQMITINPGRKFREMEQAQVGPCEGRMLEAVLKTVPRCCSPGGCSVRHTAQAAACRLQRAACSSQAAVPCCRVRAYVFQGQQQQQQYPCTNLAMQALLGLAAPAHTAPDYRMSQSCCRCPGGSGTGSRWRSPTALSRCVCGGGGSTAGAAGTRCPCQQTAAAPSCL